jgi:hypothetical protein
VRAPASAGELCWYLDSTFCWYFHMWQGEDVDVVEKQMPRMGHRRGHRPSSVTTQNSAVRFKRCCR